MFDKLVIKANIGDKIAIVAPVAVYMGDVAHETLAVVSINHDKVTLFDPIQPEADQAITGTGKTRSVSCPHQISSLAIVSCEMRPMEPSGDQDEREALNRVLLTSTKCEYIVLGTSVGVMVFNYTRSTIAAMFEVQYVIELMLSIVRPNFTDQVDHGLSSRLIVCSSCDKLFALRLDSDYAGSGVSAEISSQRTSTSFITSLASGQFDDQIVLIVGHNQGDIVVYPIEDFLGNIKPAFSTIKESSCVVCLCPISTEPDVAKPCGTGNESYLLPNFETQSQTRTKVNTRYIAFGLSVGIIGLYSIRKEDSIVKHERLWKTRSNFKPISMVMYDINGDGADELIVGYSNGRIEARLPLSGQILSVTRATRTCPLIGLTSYHFRGENQRCILATCADGSLIGYQCSRFETRTKLRSFQTQLSRTEAQSSSRSETLSDITSDGPISIIVGVDKDSSTYSSGQKFQETRHPDVRKDRKYINFSDRNEDANAYSNSMLFNETVESNTKLGHRWMYDGEGDCIELAIYTKVPCQLIKLIELEDPTTTFLDEGHIIETNFDEHWRDNRLTTFRLSQKDNQIAELHVHMHIQSDNRTSNTETSIIRTEIIKTPKFCNFVLAKASSETECPSDTPSALYEINHRNTIDKIIEWLKENFLYLKFGRYFEGDNMIMNEYEIEQSVTESDMLEVKLTDIRATNQGGTSNPNEFGSKSEYHLVIRYLSGSLYIMATRIDVLVDVVESLVIGKLQIIEPVAEQLDLSIVAARLSSLEAKVIDATETETKLIAGIHESNDHIAKLQPQLTYAGKTVQIDKMTDISREMLILATNLVSSTITYLANSHSRREAMSSIDKLREQIHFLGG